MSKILLVTGGATGIGRAVSKCFAENGYSVCIGYNSSESEAKALCAELLGSGADADIFRADVSDYDQARALAEFCEKRFGKIDVLVNNAGVSSVGLLTDTDKSDFDRIFGVNMGGVYNVTRHVLPLMLSVHRGKIINVSSVWGETGASCEALYSASKAAVIGFTKALAKEVGPSGITVNCIAPGVIDTKMNACFSEEEIAALCEEIPLGRIGKADETAKTALFLASDGADYITGQTVGVNGGMVI